MPAPQNASQSSFPIHPAARTIVPPEDIVFGKNRAPHEEEEKEDSDGPIADTDWIGATMENYGATKSYLGIISFAK